MNAPFAHIKAIKAYKSWPERWEAFRSTPYWRQALLTIAEEAKAQTIHQDNRLAMVAYDAATTADAYDRQTFIDEVEEIFAEVERASDFQHRCALYERRTGKPWDASERLWNEVFG